MPEWVVTEDAGFFNGSPPRRVILLRKDDSHQDRRLADRPEGLSLQAPTTGPTAFSGFFGQSPYRPRSSVKTAWCLVAQISATIEILRCAQNDTLEPGIMTVDNMSP